MFEKIAELLGKLNGLVLLCVALGIVAVVFVIGIIVSLGGELGKFKSLAKKVIAQPNVSVCNATAKQMPVRVRKQYKTVKQTGAKPDDVISVDACVHAPFAESAAAKFPNIVMAAGILSILFAFFAVMFVKPDKLVKITETEIADYHYIIPLLVTVGVMIFRLAAGLISSAIEKSGVRVYAKYVDALNKALGSGAEHEEAHGQTQEVPFATQETPFVHEATFAQEDTPDSAQPQSAEYEMPFTTHERIEVEEAEPEAVYVQPEAEPVAESVAEPVAEPVMQTQAESEADIRARARAEALAQARAEQAQREAAQEAARRQAAAAQQQAAPEPAQAETQSSSADEVLARIDRISKEGASLATMKEVALLLQKERAKPENKTPERQRKLNEGLAALLKAMSSATRK